MSKTIRTTIALPLDLWRAINQRLAALNEAAGRRHSQNAYIVELLRHALAQDKPKS